MRRLPFFITVSTLLALAGAPVSPAAEPFPTDHFRQASIRDLGETRDLERDFRSLASRIGDPAWIAYTLPRISGSHRVHDGQGRHAVALNARRGYSLSSSSKKSRALGSSD